MRRISAIAITVGQTHAPRCTVVSDGLYTSSKSSAWAAYPFASAAKGPLVRWLDPTIVATGSDETEAITSRNLADAGSVEPASTAANQSTTERFARCTTSGGGPGTVSDAAKSANDRVLVGFSRVSVMDS